VADLAAGHIDQCMTKSSGNITKDKLDADYQMAKGWGTLQKTTLLGFQIENSNGNFSGENSGICRFSGGVHSFKITLRKNASGQLQADTFAWQN
jgi:hypothetical protein